MGHPTLLPVFKSLLLSLSLSLYFTPGNFPIDIILGNSFSDVYPTPCTSLSLYRPRLHWSLLGLFHLKTGVVVDWQKIDFQWRSDQGKKFLEEGATED